MTLSAQTHLDAVFAWQRYRVSMALAQHRAPAPARHPKPAPIERPTLTNGGTDFQVRHKTLYVRCGCGGFKRNDAEQCKRCVEGGRRKAPAVYRAERLARHRRVA